MTVSRDAAWNLLTEWTQSESLRKHALAVEAAVRGYARQQGANEEEWAVVALLHDFDTSGIRRWAITRTKAASTCDRWVIRSG
jgi:predicted hydrolase (HD superfamily)